MTASATADVHGPSPLALEAATFRAWPAREVVIQRGMHLRVTGGESRRANAAATFEAEPAPPAELRAVLEAFYESRGLPPSAQIGPTTPAGLDAELAAAGYRSEAACWVQTAAVGTVAAALGDAATAGASVVLEGEPEGAWAHLQVARGRFAAVGEAFLGSMRTLRGRAGFAVARLGAEPFASALFVLDGPVVVLAAMRTVAEHRRRGGGALLLRAAERFAEERGARVLCLQVERDNEPALALYARAGFVTRYGYHFRTKPRGH